MKPVPIVFSLLICLFVMSCRNADNPPRIQDTQSGTSDGSSADGPRDDRKKALVIIVDNSLSVANTELEALYEQFPEEMGSALAELYEQPYAEIQRRTLSEVVEDFGEDWLIADVEAEADGYYGAYRSLTDDAATFDRFVDAIENYSDDGYLVDLLINLHGTEAGEIVFSDEFYPLTQITSEIASRELNVSVVYQTVCFGSTMLDEWEAIGIHAINGSVGDNLYVNFAPGAFLKHWIAGMNFDDAVQQAREDDIDALRTRLTDAATENETLTLLLSFYDFDTQSQQTIGGEYPQIRWK